MTYKIVEELRMIATASRGDIATKAAAHIEALAALAGDAFSTLIYIFETTDDPQTSRAAKEAADKIDTALSNLREGQGQ